ncbi:uncharacterized protein TRUGW13939_02903 [Talaromyces rugulosus]|uniref:Complex 1 LYR protein domain-containing protein n=1 Tax=Talaromyces rugulosus TaxID=121627 RepID=A0A7H8QQR4_TALRU|nr:uncharacterized protein TRUGW13939_02903 [Talaromyces rugulosus]QKX55805.1 hypothetical protein TRUGW13939_02903 [Talaromyces rugulosus]
MKWSRGPSSGVHRFACLSLYRALLRQSHRLPPTSTETENIRHLVRTKFDRYKGIQSPTRILHCLQAGYEALDLLHSACSENKDSLARIQLLLQSSRSRTPTSTPKDENISTPVSRRAEKRAENIEFQRQSRWTHPKVEPILSRPRPVVAGRRKVPVFVNARGVPFLRIKKPQPQILSQIIRQKHAYKDKLIERRNRLLLEYYFAKDEEDWDRILNGESITNATHWSKEPLWLEGSWPESVWASFQQSNDDNYIYERKNLNLARELWQVVLDERELAEKEKAEGKDQDSEIHVGSKSMDSDLAR